jgi:hypothetical protein
MTTRLPARRAALVLGTLALAVAPLHAQAIRLQLADSATGAPLGNALVDVRNADGQVVVSAVTSSAGRRVIPLPWGGGRFRLRVRRVGYRPFESAPVEVAARDTVPLALRIAAIPVALPVVTSSETSRCDLGRDQRGDGERVATLWEQLRTALALSRLTSTDRAVPPPALTTRQFVTRLSPSTRVVLRHTVLPAAVGPARPFATFTPEELSARGYVRYDDGGALFAAPDERALLSDAFTLDHCFRLVRGGGEQAGLVGLAFTPARGRSVPEIAGTLWADSATGRLRWLDFHFVDDRLPRAARGEGRAGGEVHFATLAGGEWIMSGWRLRMPHVVHRSGGRAAYDVRFVDVGAVAVPAAEDDATGEAPTPAFARLLARTRPGAAALAAVDADGRPLPGARFILRQHPDSAAALFAGLAGAGAVERSAMRLADTTVTADAAGRVHVAGLPAGGYEVRFTHPTVERTGIEPPAGDLLVTPDSVPALTLAELSPERLRDRCNGRMGGVVYGRVREGEGILPPAAIPARYATVTVRWTSPDGEAHERRATTNDRGEYAACDLPRDVPLTIQALAARQVRGTPRAASAAHTLTLDPRQAAYLTLAIPAGR